jgi:hypothetical protein
MTASERTILATCGGHLAGSRSRALFDALAHHAVELSGAHGRRPKVLYVGTSVRRSVTPSTSRPVWPRRHGWPASI